MRISTIITVRVAATALVVTPDVSADVGAAGCRHNIISITARAMSRPISYGLCRLHSHIKVAKHFVHGQYFVEMDMKSNACPYALAL